MTETHVWIALGSFIAVIIIWLVYMVVRGNR